MGGEFLPRDDPGASVARECQHEEIDWVDAQVACSAVGVAVVADPDGVSGGKQCQPQPPSICDPEGLRRRNGLAQALRVGGGQKPCRTTTELDPSAGHTVDGAQLQTS